MNRLDAIIADTKATLAERKQVRSLADCDRTAKQQSQPRGFGKALADTVAAGSMALIAEIKRASPSRGLIREDFDPAQHAKAYAKGGAACLSVLTDTPHFQGANDYLTVARESCDLPVLRKDFIIDSWQVAESRAIGADAILLIVAVLADSQLAELEKAAVERGMDVLVEVHDERELERALAVVQSPLIGINNRNLRDFSTDLSVCERLVQSLPAGRVAIAESAIHSHRDCLRLRESGIERFLVGESLMRQADLAQAVRLLLKGK